MNQNYTTTCAIPFDNSINPKVSCEAVGLVFRDEAGHTITIEPSDAPWAKEKHFEWSYRYNQYKDQLKKAGFPNVWLQAQLIPDWINEYHLQYIDDGYQDSKFLVPPLVCNDGFRMSVQASSVHYCDPKDDNQWHYNNFEIGFPSEHEKLLDKYAEYDSPDAMKEYNGVYPFVPVQIVNQIILKHGGIKGPVAED